MPAEFFLSDLHFSRQSSIYYQFLTLKTNLDIDFFHFSFFTTIGTEWASFWRIILFICNTWYYLLAVKCVLFESLILVTSLVTGSMHLIYFQSHDDSILEKNRQIEISRCDFTWKIVHFEFRCLNNMTCQKKSQSLTF